MTFCKFRARVRSCITLHKALLTIQAKCSLCFRAVNGSVDPNTCFEACKVGMKPEVFGSTL